MSANYWVAGAAFLETNEPFAYTCIPSLSRLAGSFGGFQKVSGTAAGRAAAHESADLEQSLFVSCRRCPY